MSGVSHCERFGERATELSRSPRQRKPSRAELSSASEGCSEEHVPGVRRRFANRPQSSRHDQLGRCAANVHMSCKAYEQLQRLQRPVQLTSLQQSVVLRRLYQIGVGSPHVLRQHREALRTDTNDRVGITHVRKHHLTSAATDPNDQHRRQPTRSIPPQNRPAPAPAPDARRHGEARPRIRSIFHG